MAKIVVTFNGLVQQEISILKSRLTIGRRPSNDVVIDHLTVSGQHVAIDTTSNGSFVLDLGSTNGTMVNGQPVKKHLLQNDDVIDIGKYKVRFESEPISGLPQPAIQNQQFPSLAPRAKIKILNGVNAGKEMVLNKPVTTIGSPGVQVVAISEQGKLFYISIVEGASKVTINTRVIDDANPTQLVDGDEINLSGTRLTFVVV
ncbi:pSer/pThr/pTyr-binding forkhead associated (FHA) protein [Undibacterium sp. GrIS 1.2]|uniref:FHA domain-containing protein n=1 Tax=Undibacterium sp. GrIS 1.2 TaxID=3143933 RepID=UPI0033949CF9